MAERNVEPLNDRERACLAHLDEAKKRGVSFSRYCRDQQISFHQWAWIKRALVRKGAISGRRRAQPTRVADFVAVRIAAPVATTVCRIRHPSGWTIECASYPEASWMLALMSGAAA
jgi:hypothetical protein